MSSVVLEAHGLTKTFPASGSPRSSAKSRQTATSQPDASHAAPPHTVSPYAAPNAAFPNGRPLGSAPRNPAGASGGTATPAGASGGTAALVGADFVARRGESVAIMGPSGSGKTTLLHCLAGIIVPDSGQITVTLPSGVAHVESMSDGDRSRLRREAFGFVFQEGLLIPELTAAENVALPLLLNGVDRATAERGAGEWLAALGLAGFEGRRIGQLSGGQAQRVAIARAQITGAAIIFADEPTGALDSATSAEVMDILLHTTTAQNRALVVVTHDADVAARCSRTVHLRDGRIVDGDPAHPHQADPAHPQEADPAHPHQADPNRSSGAPTGEPEATR